MEEEILIPYFLYESETSYDIRELILCRSKDYLIDTGIMDFSVYNVTLNDTGKRFIKFHLQGWDLPLNKWKDMEKKLSSLYGDLISFDINSPLSFSSEFRVIIRNITDIELWKRMR